MSETGTGTALTIIPKDRLPTILAADSDDILGKLFAELDGWEKDVSTAKGRAEIRSKIHKARIARADFKRLAATLKEDAIKTQRAVNAEANIMDDCFESLIAAIGSELREIEAAEEATRKANEDAITVLEALTDGLNEMSSEDIATRQTSVPTFTWAIEFRAKGERVRSGAIAQLHMAYQAAVQREADALAEAARLAEQVERDRLAAIEAQRAREERIAVEAAERARLAAEAEAERKRVEDAAASQALLDAAETREREKAEELRTTEARLEAIRIENHKDALARIRLLTTHVSDLPIRDIDDRLEKVEVLWQREWEEFAEEAQTTADATCDFLVAARATEAGRLEGMRIAAHESALSDFTFLVGSVAGQPGSAEVTQSIAQLQRLHANRDWEEFTERATKERADTMALFQGKFQSAKAREKKAADELAEAQQRATIEAERHRVSQRAAAQKADDERRAADKAHRGRLNREIVADLLLLEKVGIQITEEIAKGVVIAMASGRLRHVKVEY